MKSICIGFLFLAVLASNAIARKDPGEYWQYVMKDEQMPEYIQGLVGASKVTCPDHKNPNKNDGLFHITPQKTSSPSLTANADDVKPENHRHSMADQLQPRQFHLSSDKTSFDPFPSHVTAYTNDVKPENQKHFTKEFEPTPNVSAYSDDAKPEGEKRFTKEFEPIPNVSAYSDEAKPEGEFEPRTES